MKSNWVKFPLLLMIVLVLINGCGQSDNQSPDSVDTEQIGIRGMVKELTKGDQQISILVEGELEEDTQYDLAVVTVNKQTEVVREGTHIAILLDPLVEIKEGDFIEVIFTGGVAESYPVQAVAAKVTILSYE